jgi:uncharacterized protein YndB with AHSA1/START domain
MNEAPKTIEFRFERTIPAPAGEVFDAWLNPKVPGTTWHEADKLLLNPQVDGFFYWLIRGNAHYGRFTEVQRPARLQYTWMSRSTLGEESTVTVTFSQRGEATLMAPCIRAFRTVTSAGATSKAGTTSWGSSLSSSGMPHTRKNRELRTC